MTQFLMRRVSIMIPMMLLMSVVAFGIIQAPPGDYLQTYIATLGASGEYIDAAEAETLRSQYGLDRPIYVQYYKWMKNMLRGNLGVSLEYGRPVNELIGERLLLTLVLGLFTVMFTWTLAIPIGIVSARQAAHLHRLLLHLPVVHGRGDAQLPPGAGNNVVPLVLVRT